MRSYGVVTANLGLEQQLCLTHVRKAVTKRSKTILAQARNAWSDPQQIDQLARELAQTRMLVRELPADGGQEMEHTPSPLSRCTTTREGRTCQCGVPHAAPDA